MTENDKKIERLKQTLERARLLCKSRREKGVDGIRDFVSDVDGDWLENL